MHVLSRIAIRCSCYHSTQSPSYNVQAILSLDNPQIVLNDYTVADADHTTFSVTSDIQYVAVICAAFKKTTGFQLDAVDFTP